MNNSSHQQDDSLLYMMPPQSQSREVSALVDGTAKSSPPPKTGVKGEALSQSYMQKAVGVDTYEDHLGEPIQGSTNGQQDKYVQRYVPKETLYS